MSSVILTINESQELTHESVVIIQSKAIKVTLHDSISHAVVVFIMEHNIIMAISYRDKMAILLPPYLTYTTSFALAG